jgi:conjugal transfer/type IV secretion protein DotA/TraY
MFSGAIQTAQEGTALGRRSSPVWLPLRMTAGVVGMFPAMGGFSISQAVMLTTTTLGIGGANFIMNKAVDMTAQFAAVVPMSVGPAPVGGAFVDAAEGIFIGKVCMLAKKSAQDAEVMVGTADPDVIRTFSVSGAPVSVMYGTTSNPTMCGSVSVVDSYKSGLTGGWGPFSVRSTAVNYDSINEAVKAAFVEGFDPMRQDVEALAEDWFNRRQDFLAGRDTGGAGMIVPNEKIREAAFRYATRASNGAFAAIQSGTGDRTAIARDAIDQMKQFGWFGLGSWHSTFSAVGAAIREAALQVKIETVPPDTSGLSPTVRDTMVAAAQGYISSKGSAASAGADGIFGPMAEGAGVGQWLVQGMMGTMVGTGGSGLVDPILGMKNLGDSVLVMAETAILMKPVSSVIAAVVDAGTDAASGVAPGGGLMKKVGGAVLSAAAEALGPLLSTIVTFMFILGIFMSIYVPMVPMLNWAGALVQYVSGVLEGLAAAPVWALMHMDFEGEGMGQRTTHGWLFALNQLVRPSLMCLSFFLCNGIMVVMGTFLTMMFVPAMASAQGTSITGVVSIVGYLAIYGILIWSLVQGLTNMYSYLPDQIIGWAGGQAGSRIGQEVENKVHGMFMAYGRSVGSAFGRPPGHDPKTSVHGGGKKKGGSTPDAAQGAPRQR